MVRKIALCIGSLCVAHAYIADRVVASGDASFQSALETLLSVRGEGEGNVEAAEAWRIVARRDASAIPSILSAMDRAGPLAANWLLSAVDAICERTDRADSPYPVDEVRAFLADASQNARARRIAFELLAKIDPADAKSLVPEFLHDPSPELRREAVAHWTGAAELAFGAGDLRDAKENFAKALSGAVDQDQVDLLAKRLGECGVSVDKAAHYGFVRRWMIVGPFDNRDEKGYFVAYPPEASIDYSAEYDGKSGRVAWRSHISSDAMGRVDLNQAVGAEKGVVAYASTTFTLDRPRRVQIRLSTPNGWKLWVNGRYVFGREEYHSGESFDQHEHDVEMQAGENQILVKCCQNEQTEEWAGDWRFALRVCDPSGAAVSSTTRTSSAQTSNGGEGS